MQVCTMCTHGCLVVSQLMLLLLLKQIFTHFVKYVQSQVCCVHILGIWVVVNTKAKYIAHCCRMYSIHRAYRSIICSCLLLLWTQAQRDIICKSIHSLKSISSISFFMSLFLRSKSGYEIRNFPRHKIQRPVFLQGNHLNTCPDSDLRKN